MLTPLHAEHLQPAVFEMSPLPVHDLRRFRDSALHANGASLEQVSVRLGHSGVGATERYLRVLDRQLVGHDLLQL